MQSHIEIKQAGATGSAHALIGVRMLFIDAQADSRWALQQQLRQHGMRADGFETAAQAIDALEQAAHAKDPKDPYRVAVLDQQMPGVDGETLGIALKSDPVHSDTLLVLLSTLLRASDAERCAQSGFSAFLSKPVSTPLLLDTLATLCAEMQSGSATAARSHCATAVSAPVDDDELLPFAASLATGTVPHSNDGLDAIRDLFGADFCGLAALYLEDSSPRIAALFLATDDNDAVKLGKIAHALSGSSASIGASRVAALCRDLEVRSKAGVPPDMRARLAAIESAFATVELRLQSMMGQ